MARTSRAGDDGIKWILFLLPWEAKVYEDISKEFLSHRGENGGSLDEPLTIELHPDHYRGLFGLDTYRETIRRFIEAGILAQAAKTEEDQAVETYQLLISPRECLFEKISHRYLAHAPKAWAEEVVVIRDAFLSLAGTPLSLDEWLVKTFSCTKREAYRIQARYSNYDLEVECRQTRHLGILKGRHGGYLLNRAGLTFADVISAEGGTRLRGKVTRIPWPDDVDKTFIGSVLPSAQIASAPVAAPLETLPDLSVVIQGLTCIAPELKEDVERLIRLRGDCADRREILQKELDALPAKQVAIDASLREVLALNERYLRMKQELQTFRERTPME